jgi:hypothetical protein
MNQFMVFRYWYEEVGDLENGPKLVEQQQFLTSFPTREEADAYIKSHPLDTLFVDDTVQQLNDFQRWMQQQ